MSKQNNKNKGFTLIELLIALVIIGVILGISLATINLSQPSVEQKIKTQFNNLLEQTKNFAVVYNKITRINIDNKQGNIVTEYFDYDKNLWKAVDIIDELTFTPLQEDQIIDSESNQYIIVEASGRVLVEKVIINTENNIIVIDSIDDNKANDSNFVFN